MRYRRQLVIETSRRGAVAIDALFWLLMIPVFYSVTAITQYIDIPSRNVTVPLRLAIALIAVLVFANGIARGSRLCLSGWVVAALSFICLYAGRVAIDQFDGRTDVFGGDVVFLFSVTTAVPALYGIVRPFPTIKVAKMLWWALAAAALLVGVMYGQFASTGAGLRSHAVTENFGIVNPIVVGHIGALLVELSLYILLSGPGNRSFIPLVGLLGTWLLSISNSRGPVLALVLVSTVVVIGAFVRSRYDRYELRRMALLSVASAGVILGMLFFIDNIILERFSQIDEFGSGREILYNQCVRAAFDNPWCGYGVFLQNPDGSLSGSESFVLDGYLGTGLFSGSVWVVILVYALVRGARWYFRKPEWWLFLLYVHGLVFFGLSGGLVAASWGVVSLFAVLGAIARFEARPSISRHLARF